MIIGLGVDMVELNKMESALHNHPHFIERILTRNEIADLPTQQQRRIEFVAGRFAVKEAVSKALGTGIGQYLSWQDIEIIKQPTGEPKVLLLPQLFSKHPRLRGLTSEELFIWCSISHTDHDAIAQVLIERKY